MDRLFQAYFQVKAYTTSRALDKFFDMNKMILLRHLNYSLLIRYESLTSFIVWFIAGHIKLSQVRTMYSHWVCVCAVAVIALWRRSCCGKILSTLWRIQHRSWASDCLFYPAEWGYSPHLQKWMKPCVWACYVCCKWPMCGFACLHK